MEKFNHLQFDFQNFLICPKCNLMIENPYEMECCGTLYCYNCIRFIEPNRELCNICKKTSTFRQNSFVKRISNQMILYCGFNCGSKYSFSEIRYHMIKCDKRIYICNICIKSPTNLLFKATKKELLMHFIEAHEKELLNVNERYMEIMNNEENKKENHKKKNLNNINSTSRNNIQLENSYYNEEDNSSYQSDLNENYSGYVSAENIDY